MIKDTCPCGAAFEVQRAAGEEATHRLWDKAHKPCRVAWAEAVKQRPPQPLSIPTTPLGPFPATSPTIITHTHPDTKVQP